MSIRPLARLLVVAVASAALLAGCGGGSDRKASDAYAHEVCAAVGTWLTAVKHVDTLPPPAGMTKISIEGSLSHFEAATRLFVSRVRAVRAPDTSDGRTAKQRIDYLVTRAQAENGSAKAVSSTVASAGSIMDVLGALSALPDYRTLKATAQSTLASLRSGGGPLAPAFKSEPACKRLS